MSSVEQSSVVELLNAFATENLPFNSSSGALEAARRVSAGPAYLVAFTVANTNAAAQFIQFHDSVAIPANGAIPDLLFTAAGSADKTVSYTLPGVYFASGIVVCNSSTAATKTLGSADCFFACQYLPVQ